MRTFGLAAVLAGFTALAHAQGAAGPAASASGPGAAMTRAAGMPLNDGSLAPGMLTVRIVRGDFSNNVPEQVVTVAVTGGKAEQATTGADGRAQFAHLPVGATVRASAVVDGEPLESEAFAVPAQSGVRVLLIVGDGLATASGPVAAAPPPDGTVASPLASSGLSQSSSTEVSTPERPAAPDDGALGTIRMVMLAATVLAVGWLVVRHRGSRGAGG